MKNFRLNLIVRLLAIFLSFFIFSYLFFKANIVIALVVIAILIILQITLLIQYVDITNRTLTRFFESIRFSDFSFSFSKQKYGKSFNDLTNELIGIQKSFKETRKEKEKQFHFFQTIIQNASVGIIVFDRSGEIKLLNNSAKKLLRVRALKNVKDFTQKNFETSINLMELRAGDKKTIKYSDQNEIVQLAIQVSEFTDPNTSYTLLSIQNIQNELNEKEIESWQKLIKVLTHEIMNSITPISSLASTVNNLLSNTGEDNVLIAENLEDIKQGVGTIKKRSEGLLHFVDKYRSLTKISNPSLQVIPVIPLFERIENLMKKEFINDNITFRFKVIPRTLKLTADPELVEQVLLNLIYNSIGALNNSKVKSISLNANQTFSGRVEIRVIDNGQGISDDIKEQIFVPFYTTKRDGSGIGLSLAKQIMHLHGGDISVSSVKNAETTFYLLF